MSYVRNIGRTSGNFQRRVKAINGIDSPRRVFKGCGAASRRENASIREKWRQAAAAQKGPRKGRREAGLLEFKTEQACSQ